MSDLIPNVEIDIYAFVNGDSQAFKKFYSQNYSFWLKYATKHLKQELHAQEVVLEAFSEAYEQKRTFTNLDDACAFVVLRIHRSCNEYLLKLDEEEREAQPYGILRYRQKKFEEILNNYENFVLQLTECERQIYILYFFAEKEGWWISHLLGDKVRFVKLKLKIAIAKLFKLKAIADGYSYNSNYPFLANTTCIQLPEFTLQIEMKYGAWLTTIVEKMKDEVWAEATLLFFLFAIWQKREELKDVAEVAELVEESINEIVIEENTYNTYENLELDFGGELDVKEFIIAHKNIASMELSTRCIILLSYLTNVQICDAAGMFCFKESKAYNLIQHFKRSITGV